jgi:hypothetical protein
VGTPIFQRDWLPARISEKNDRESVEHARDRVSPELIASAGDQP